MRDTLMNKILATVKDKIKIRIHNDKNTYDIENGNQSFIQKKTNIDKIKDLFQRKK